MLHALGTVNLTISGVLINNTPTALILFQQLLIGKMLSKSIGNTSIVFMACKKEFLPLDFNFNTPVHNIFFNPQVAPSF